MTGRRLKYLLGNIIFLQCHILEWVLLLIRFHKTPGLPNSAGRESRVPHLILPFTHLHAEPEERQIAIFHSAGAEEGGYDIEPTIT